MQNDAVKTLINSPDLSQRKKAEIFTSLFEGEISNKVANFVLVIGQANRINLLESVLESFKRLVALEKNQKNVTVASSYALDQEQLKKIFPKKYWNRLHLQIIWYGREYCKARDCHGITCKICKSCYPNRKKPIKVKKA